MERHLRSVGEWLGLVDTGSRRYQWAVGSANVVLAGGGLLLFGFWGFLGGLAIVAIGTIVAGFVFER